ncbi:hypothetical protein BGZ61DRAFT_442622 [Ilyonectria robusta]|uniref:uncharacterized protein n=1 Tax=Ilyonectria robusta TaxID=1079257 RepID=UPI001E8E14B5|nr:uncharacterized protein BGZ61DRAFT_442622 [Ilyonectria robusta]KAH8734488.1 hypothetical protein BGZ61DRAFT_442622 [Ilyonectria robusta]
MMWIPRSDQIDPVTRSAGAAVACSVLTHCLSSRRSELGSEMIGWILLPVLCNIARQSNDNTIPRAVAPSGYSPTQSTSTRSLWIAAISILAFCLCRAENIMVAYLPAFTPLLLIAQKYFDPKFLAPRPTDSWLFSAYTNTVWGITSAALFAILALSNWDLRASSLSIIPVAVSLLVCVALLPRSKKNSQFLPLGNIEDSIRPLSFRIVPLFTLVLCVQAVWFGFSGVHVASTLFLGAAKALSWYFTTRMALYAPWCIIPIIATFSIVSTRNPFTQSSEAHAVSHIIAAFLVLGQAIHLLPKQAKAKSTLWAFYLIPLVPYLANTFMIMSAQASAPNFSHTQPHPVEAMIRKAEDDFKDKLQRQSADYTSACDEYRRRYRMEPPPGFDTWYEFAVSHQSPIIDDFDILYDAVSPLWRLSGQEVGRIMNDAQKTTNSELWLCLLSGTAAETHCTHPYRTFDRHFQLLFDTLLKNLKGKLPDVRFLINHLDEPRVLMPPPGWEGLDSSKGGLLNLTNMSKRPTWDTITKFCAPQPSNQPIQHDKVETFSLPFITDIHSAMDLCQHPEYSATHGFAISPMSFRLVEGFVPILSTGSPSTMGDVLFPSPAYIESEFQYDAARDIEWDRKRNSLYWAGSTTGGFAGNNQWFSYHRQRFVSLAQNLGWQQHLYLRERQGVINTIKSSFLNSRLFDVAFTRIFQCQRRSCREQEMFFNSKPWADKDQALRSRLVFDMDGNGISGRFYKLLASKSVPLKQTIFREWHDDRLIPWVHYIPVSQSMEEVPELVFYLTSTENGRRQAKVIAENGRSWFAKAVREVDLSIYTYRLLLELARLQDPERQASSL